MILITNEDDEDTNVTSNIIYIEVFRNLLVKWMYLFVQASISHDVTLILIM